jgi:hypothetical protein
LAKIREISVKGFWFAFKIRPKLDWRKAMQGIAWDWKFCFLADTSAPQPLRLRDEISENKGNHTEIMPVQTKTIYGSFPFLSYVIPIPISF